MDVFRQWVLCVMVAAAAGTFVCAISPKGSTDKTVRTVAGIFVVAAICAPLSELDIEKISVPAFASSYEENNSGKELEEYMLSVCRSAVDGEISAAAQEHGIMVESVFVDAYIDENKCIIIQDVEVNIQSDDNKSVSDFSQDVEKRIGVSVNIRNGISD